MTFVKDQIAALLKTALESLELSDGAEIHLEYPLEAVHGDYSTNLALTLSKKAGRPPRELAQALLEALEPVDWIDRVEIAGPGFINFYLSRSFLSNFSSHVLGEGEQYGSSSAYKGQTVVTDSSHPNVAKPLGVHHLLSTILGGAINKMLAQVGYTVIRDNYLGDWGTQFGKLLYAYKTWGDEAVVKADPIPELLKLYIRFHDEVEADPSIEDKGRAEFKKLEQGDAENKELWEWVVGLSLKEFFATYERLGVTFDQMNGESFYEDKMAAIIKMGVERGLFVEGEKGALICPFDHDRYPPCLIRKSDGATLYATRDLARIKYWEETWHPQKMINIVDTAQQMYFQQIFEVAKKMELTPAENIHLWFGRMRFPEKKMSTRKGNIVLLEEVLDEAEERAFILVEEKSPHLPEAKKREIARMIGIGALKYAVLAQNPTTDITFTWDKMLSLEGNSSPYLQYSVARAHSILRKAEEEGGEVVPADQIAELTENAELTVARLLPRYPEVLVHATNELRPNLVANYLFELASAFNSFYGNVHVLKAEPKLRARRLILVEATAQVLKNGLKLFGIETPEEM
ncbi:arginine--tRNA ligase [Candidatus Peregrinibacteria bacterium CG_4_9_14_0_2_um_filter_53_11]|nr:MAG: arginine--tRNA ligase [Candidatus Peregrinibacteria bacterium CG_4_9_14_0_2_um_filter_53_11]